MSINVQKWDWILPTSFAYTRIHDPCRQYRICLAEKPDTTQYSTVTVNVTDESGKKTSYSDWKVESVERKTEGDLSSFTAKYSNDSIKDYKWTPNEDVTIQIKPIDSKDITLDFEYKTSGTKDHWYDYLQFWKGHKNHWYDYAKVWENSVKFVRVK